jgi:hypothetical protein
MLIRKVKVYQIDKRSLVKSVLNRRELDTLVVYSVIQFSGIFKRCTLFGLISEDRFCVLNFIVDKKIVKLLPSNSLHLFFFLFHNFDKFSLDF